MLSMIWYLKNIPRQARIDAPGALHNIIIRGIERKATIKNNADRTNFLKQSGYGK